NANGHSLYEMRIYVRIVAGVKRPSRRSSHPRRPARPPSRPHARRGRQSAAVRAAADAVLARQGIDAGAASELALAAICPRPAVQERSRATLERILDAAEAVLAEDGLDAATVPRIAARAGASVGAVYRRFPDKDAVLRAVYGRFFARAMAQQCAALAQAPRLPESLPELAGLLIGSLVGAYRLKRGILRALVQYARTHHDPEFRRQADQMNAHNLRQAEELLLPHAAA